MTEDEMVDGTSDSVGMSLGKLQEFMDRSDGQGGPACCGPWGCKELHTTEQLN